MSNVDTTVEGPTNVETDNPEHPSSAMQGLERLIGTWTVTGGARGEVHYEWMPGRFFLLQHVRLNQGGYEVTGIEVIGHLRPFGEPTGADIVSRFYDAAGNTLDYTYELDGDTLTIWAGPSGSPTYFRGDFTTDGDTLSGEWTYPGGGGYASTMTRV